MRFRLREALRPFELRRLLSLGARVEESLSTRLDSVRVPDLLCVSRLRELPLERLFDEDFDFDEELLDFEEELLDPPERLLLLLLLLLDREDLWGILPSLLLSWFRDAGLPALRTSNHHLGTQFKSALLRVVRRNRRCE